MPEYPQKSPSDPAFPVTEFVLGEAPVVASAMLFQISAQAIANAALNAAFAQQQLNILAQAVTSMCVAELLAIEHVQAGSN